MNQNKILKVSAEDAGLRIDRYITRNFPNLSGGLVQKLLRKKDIKLNGKKVDGGTRINENDEVSLSHIVDENTAPKTIKKVSKEDEAFAQSLVLYKDKNIIVINKPHGLAVQGGSKILRHLDGLLDALKFDYEERPRLVHRLDKDTSGVMVLARSANSAAELAKGFKNHEIKKLYWAITHKVPRPLAALLDLPLAVVSSGKFGEMIAPDEKGQKAITAYNTVSQAGEVAAWLELMPMTGRKHQLRVHCAALKTPIMGDGKYSDREVPTGIEPKLHLHARTIRIPIFLGKDIEVTAPIPEHIKNTFDVFGFDEREAEKNPFERLV